jgi:BMFP domain-containing protein YqiC
MRIVDERVTRSEDALRELMNARFATLEAKIEGLEKRLDLVQRVALLEAKVREIEAKGK